MTTSRRIGSHFLGSGVGLGGSCFKDVLSLVYIAELLYLPQVAAYWSQVLQINEWQQRRFAERIILSLNGSLRGKKVAILSYAFKADTNDTRETPAAEVIKHLFSEGSREIAIYDPGCNPLDLRRELDSLFGEKAEVLVPYGDVYSACDGANALAIVTDWHHFHSLPEQQTNPSLEGLLLKHCLDQQSIPDTPLTHFAGHALCPDLPCAEDCTDCLQASLSAPTTRSKDMDKPLDYHRVASLMADAPKWVFDGRNVIVEGSLEAMGVGYVHSIGKNTLG